MRVWKKRKRRWRRKGERLCSSEKRGGGGEGRERGGKVFEEDKDEVDKEEW